MRAGFGVALVGLVVCVGCEPSKQEKAIAAIKALGHYAKKLQWTPMAGSWER